MPKIRKMLNDWDAPYLQSLIKIVKTQSKITLTNWALNYSEQYLLPLWFKYYPNDLRPLAAIEVARAWLVGLVKLPVARPIILDTHAAGKLATNPAALAAARAIAHSAATIHSARHCLGLAFYGALALTYEKYGWDLPWNELEQLASKECTLMEEALRKVAIIDEPNPAKINWKEKQAYHNE